MFSVEEKDRILTKVGLAPFQRLCVSMTEDVDRQIYLHLKNMGLLKEDTKKCQGNKSQLSFTDKGAQLYASEGFKKEAKKELREKIWKAIEFIKPW